MGDLAIDWEHNLANGLIGCWVPGAMGGVDLTGNAPTLAVNNGVFNATVEGVGLTAGSSTFAGLAPPSYLGVGALTTYQRSFFPAPPNNFNTFFSISWNGSPTFWVLTMDDNGSGLFRFGWNTGGSFVQSTANYPSNNTIFSSSVGYNFSANSIIGYINGVQQLNSTFGSSLPTFTGTSRIVSQNTGVTLLITCVWNRQLSAAESYQMHIAPYDFLVPAEAEMPLVFLPPPPPPPPTQWAEIEW